MDYVWTEQMSVYMFIITSDWQFWLTVEAKHLKLTSSRNNAKWFLGYSIWK